MLRVSLLVRSQFRFSIAKSESLGAEALNQFKTEMLQTPYQIIKERHIKELELEDDLMSKVPIRYIKLNIYIYIIQLNKIYSYIHILNLYIKTFKRKIIQRKL